MAWERHLPMTIIIMCKCIYVLLFLIYIPFMVTFYVIVGIYKTGSLICIVLSLWRIWQRDYGVTYGEADESKKNLTPALDLFYSLVLFQGALYMLWCILVPIGALVVPDLRRTCQFPEGWGIACIVDYFFETKARFSRDPAPICGWTMINFAVELLGSDSWEDYLSGARMLDVFIKHGEDVRPVLLPSRPKIQKLIDTLGWSSIVGVDREIRELAARIVAALAEDIHLSQFPGAIQCISSLLRIGTTSKYRNRQGPPTCENSKPYAHRKMLRGVKTMEKLLHMKKEEEQGSNCNELILQGLTILERLAHDHHNCMEICSTPFLLRKIKAPVCSHTMIKDIKSSDWADVVKGCLKVLHRLICSPAKSGKRLRREISTDKQAVRNLESIIYHEKAGLELQKLAMEILTDLLLDSSINLAGEMAEKFIKKQLQVFLLGDGDSEAESSSSAAEVGETAPKSDLLKVTAGRTLALLAASSKTYSGFIMKGLDSAVDRLANIMFDAENEDYLYRARAVEIMEHLCGHSVLEKELVKGTLLPKVLAEILSHKNGGPESKNSAPGNDDGNLPNNSIPQNDEENQKLSTQGDGVEQPNISEEEDEEQTTPRELLKAFLALTLMISDKVISAEDLCDAIEKQAEGPVFVAKLKAIIEENCKATTIGGLRIVKLCGRIAVIMMRCNRFAEHFRNQEFTKALSDARKLMSNLESCVLFSETDGGLEKVARPLLSDIEEKALELVG